MPNSVHLHRQYVPQSDGGKTVCHSSLADHLGCVLAELQETRVLHRIRGIGCSMTGSEAGSDAVRVVADFGGDLSRHQSRMVTMDMLLWADHIFAMTESHADAPAPIGEIQEPLLLSPQGDDVADPIGGAFEDYRPVRSKSYNA